MLIKIEGEKKKNMEEEREEGEKIEYGNLIKMIIKLMIIEWVMFIVVKIMKRIKKREEEKNEKEDKYEEVMIKEIRDIMEKKKKEWWN